MHTLWLGKRCFFLLFRTEINGVLIWRAWIPTRSNGNELMSVQFTRTKSSKCSADISIQWKFWIRFYYILFRYLCMSLHRLADSTESLQIFSNLDVFEHCTNRFYAILKCFCYISNETVKHRPKVKRPHGMVFHIC